MILVPRSHTHTHKSERMKSMAPLLFSTLAFGAKSRCLAIWSEKGAPGGGFLGLRAMQPFQKPFYFHTLGFSPFSVVDSHLFRETRRPSTSYTDEDYMLLSFVYFLFFSLFCRMQSNKMVLLFSTLVLAGLCQRQHRSHAD